MTSSSPRKRPTTAPTRGRNDAATRRRAAPGGALLGAVLLLAAALPAAAVDLRDAASPSSALPASAGGTRVLRSARVVQVGGVARPMTQDGTEGVVLRVSRSIEQADGEPGGLPVKSILPTVPGADAAPADVDDTPAPRRQPDRAGADTPPEPRSSGRAIDRLPPRRDASRDDSKRRDGDAADSEAEPSTRAGSRSRATDRAGDRTSDRAADRGSSRRDAARKDPCAESAKACRQALEFLRDDDIASIDLDIRVGGKPGNDYPCECLLEGETFQPRRFASTTMTWKAAGYCHKPLYFEDWELERYGHSRGMFLDPFIAGAHFFVTLPILPYKAGMQAPWECVYPLGYYRPGSCAPWTVPAVPYSARGFAVQGATVTGLVFLLP